MQCIHAAEVVLPIIGDPITDGAVLIDGDRILAVGPRAQLVAEHPGTRVRQWPGVLTPGLVNAHTHLIYSDLADMATLDLPFPEWISQFPIRRKGRTAVEWQASTRRGIHAALTTGTTAVADIAEGPSLAAVSRAGLQGISYLEIIADGAMWLSDQRARLQRDLAAAPAGRIIGLSPHTLYTVDMTIWSDVVDLARRQCLRLHPHLAESPAETQFVLDGTGQFAELNATLGMSMELMTGGCGASPTRLMAQLGALGPATHVAHGVHCDSVDRKLLRQSETAVALCTRSNRILQAGEAPIAAYLQEGNTIALGTDSLASSPDLDLLAEAAAARDLARAQGYTGDDLDRRLVEAATLGGAQAMGLTEIGALAPGLRADLAVFAVPVDRDPYSSLIDHPGSCVGTILGGRLLHRRR
ncbi:amidohydrolase [Pseudonocardiaceae bacterium YIM PH 21723]|nr:amidohydrolase [Pseudonocardiaceae bacterium YIM PH 21723]